MHGKVIDNRYKLLEQEFHDNLCTVYEALDQAENLPVTVKLFRHEIKHRLLERLLRFRREVENVSRAAHPNLLKIFASGEFEGQEYLVTEHVNGAQPLSSHVEEAAETDSAADIMLQVCAGLAAAHEKGVIHQALNPSSILLFQHGAGPTAKLTDFGIGLLLDLAGIKEESEVVRTFGYMSPEATGILQKPVDTRSDLYSLGIIFFQLATGRLPYDVKDTPTLIHQHIAQKPPLPTELNPSIPEVIERIILRLIAKEPLDRYQTVSGLITDLEEYQRQRAEGKEVPDFEISRSDRAGKLSFTTHLIGRDEQLNRLQAIVMQCSEGKGSLSIVCGHPGVGKTRLIDEVRGHVHSLGGMFVGGSSQLDAKIPFEVFREALDAYVQKLKRASKEEREGAVKRMRDALGDLGGEVVKIVPDIVDLIGEPPELVELEPEKARIRFLMTVTGFILSLGTQQNPLILFLDDLQWADEGSIELLERIGEKAATHPIAMLASFRDTEVDKDHPLMGAIDKLKQNHLPLYQFLLKPFEIDDTSCIVSEILLEEEQEVLPLAKEIQGRTEGNPFFVIELLRSLVDEKVVYFEDNHFQYDLAKLAQAGLPTDIVEVVIKRISEVSEQCQTVLSYASVMGRDISFERLSDLIHMPQEQILDALEEGIENQFLVRDITGEEAVHFAHDRILEAFYQKVPEDERKALHQYIGLSLEARNKDNLEPVLYELARHFSSAGLDEKTLVYSTRGGKKAQDAYANDQAIKLYEHAREILERQGKTKTDDYIDVLENMGAVYKTAGRFDEALAVLNTCEQLIPKEDKIRRAEVLSKAGDTLWEKGEGGRATKLLGRALKSLGVRLPRTMFGVVTGLVKESLIQGLHTILPFLFVRKEYKHNAKKAVIVRLLLRVAYFYYFTNLIRTLHLGMKYLNMGERMGPSRLLSNVYSTHTVIWAGVPFAAGRAQRDAKRSVKIAHDLNDRGAEGSAFGYYAVSTYSNRDIEEAYEYALKSIDILKGIGEYWDLGMGLYYRPSCGVLLGKNLETLIQEVEEMIHIAQSSQSRQALGWGRYHKARLLALIGDQRLQAEGIKSGEEGVKTMELVKDKVSCLQAKSYLAFAHLRAGNYDDAVRITKEVAARYLLDNNACAFIHDVFPISAQVYLDTVRYKADLAEDEKKKYLKKAKRFSKLAFRLKRFFPYLASYSYQVNGTCQWLCGNKKKAVKIWEDGITYIRENTEDTYRRASILLEEASFLITANPDDKRAQQYLMEAKEIFIRLGAKLDAKRIDQLLGTVSPEEEMIGAREALTVSRQLESLLNVTQAIGSIFDLEELLDKIIDQAMKVTGAERGFLLLYDEEDNTLRQKVSRGVEKKLASQSFSYATHKVSIEMVQEVEQRGEGVVEGQNGTGFPKIAADLKEYDVKEALCVPLKAKDKPLGMIYLDNRMAGGIFGQNELGLMSSFAVQASVSIENARLHQKAIDQERMEQDLEVASEIQRLFLPKTVELIENVSINAYYSPAEFIGGDYYDVIKIDDTRYGIIIVDISGHGSSAAIVMSVISFIVHSSAQKVKDTAELMTELNNNLYERLEGEKYATGIFMVYDTYKESFEYTNAGHSSIMLYKKKDDELLELSEGGLPIGIMEDSKYEKGEFKFEQGDLILLQTDGVFETRNDKGKMFSSERVKQLFLNLKDQEIAEINKTIISEVRKFQGGGPQQDDIALIALKKIGK